MSDEDVRSIVAYLRSVAPVRAPGPVENLGCRRSSTGEFGVREPGHRLYMAGATITNDMPGVGQYTAPNMTPDRETGLGRFSKAQLRQAIRTNRRLDGSESVPHVHSLGRYYANMPDEDLDALIDDLYSLEPVRHPVPPRRLETPARP